jgi:hypothetical protein
MKIEIIQIVDRGIANKERLWLRVLGDCDLSHYIVLLTSYVSVNAISNLLRNAYWFNPKAVRSGDYVILYTGKGVTTTSKNNDGSTNHFVYWGLDKTIWNAINDCAVVTELNTWQTSKYQQ